METYDVGSMPFEGDLKKFSEGATQLVSQQSKGKTHSLEDSAIYFERSVVDNFLDKIKAGIDIPNYPQFRDMVEMFFQMIDGVEKLNGGYVEVEELSLIREKADIPEVLAIRRNSKEVYERTNCAFRVKVCITGPYTLASMFVHRRPQIYGMLGDVLSKVVEKNVFDEAYGRVEILAIDEPIFGLVDDPMLDRGSEGRENLLHAWEIICHKALARKAQTCLHLHSTANDLFWEVRSLRIIESHVDDPLYSSKRTKKLIDSTDKLLKASICLSNFDELIRRHLRSISKAVSEDLTQKVGEVWKEINKRKINPNIFLESIGSMRKRLQGIVEMFGSERVAYAGPECGLRSFPTYESAVECLRRVSRAAKIAE
ncbi:MAG: hypothetical protein QXL67_00850 [Candidatus Bathyarchaeia archaeon]